MSFIKESGDVDLTFLVATILFGTVCRLEEGGGLHAVRVRLGHTVALQGFQETVVEEDFVCVWKDNRCECVVNGKTSEQIDYKE